MATSTPSEVRRRPPPRGRRQLEERAIAIGKKLAPLLDPTRIAASLDTLATAAYQLQSAEPGISESLNGLAAILHAAHSKHLVSFFLIFSLRSSINKQNQLTSSSFIVG
jgi:hypothetical protein